MGPTDIVSYLDLDTYPIIALVLFLVAFGIILWAVIKTPRSETAKQAMIPLEDEVQTPFPTAHSNTTQPKGVTRG